MLSWVNTCSMPSWLTNLSRLVAIRSTCSFATRPMTTQTITNSSINFTRDVVDGVDTKVGILQLNRRASLNSLTPEIGEQFEALVKDKIVNNKSLRALIITGSGRSFSAGGDYNFLHARTRDTIPSNMHIMLRFYNNYLALRQLPIPVIAAINGHAVGAGLCLALACDVRIAAATAKLGLNFLKLGMCPAFGASQLLPTLVGHENAMRMLLTGDLMSGQHAHQLGLVSQVEAAEQVLPKALELARKMAQVSPTCMHDTIRMLRRRAEGPGGLQDVLEQEAQLQAASFVRPDFAEGLLAQQQKRVPEFADRQ